MDDSLSPPAFPHPYVTVDVAVLTVWQKQVHVLVIKTAAAPFAGHWALPGAFVQKGENITAAAGRALLLKTGVTEAIPHLEQLATFGDPARDTRAPYDHVISVAYFALVAAPGSELPDAPPLTPTPGGNAQEAAWLPVEEADGVLVSPAPLAFDHADILATAIKRVRGKIEYNTLAHALLPDEFTLTELQTIYETIHGTPEDKRNFRKRMLSLDILVSTNKQRRLGAHRPAELFRFYSRESLDFSAVRARRGADGSLPADERGQ